VLTGKPEGRRQHARAKGRCEINIKIYLKEI
jgi:hypothetical protein